MKTLPYLALLIACTATLQAAPPAGKPQQLTSPDQVLEGLAKSDWSSIRAAYEAGRHAFMPIEGGWQARNPGQQWTTKFDGRGFVAQPRDGGWQWGLELKSYGFGETQTPIGGTPAVKAAGARLSYQWDAAVQEWWVNDARGLEHGFTVLKRPPSGSPLNAPPSTLNFLLAVRGTLHPRIAADAQGVEFRDGQGATVLTYSGLKVWDADGKTLPSHFAAAEVGVRLLVDERGARYPLTIDPIAQQAYLKASNTQGGDQFGYSVAVSGDTVVVGAKEEDSSTTGVNSTPNEISNFNSGAAYVFKRSGTTWTQQAYLKASNTGGSDWFGWSVAVSGDTVIVGAQQEGSSTTGVNSTPNESAPASGAAYVFTRSGTTWTQQAFLKASNTERQDHFGGSVSVSGDTVIVGAHQEASSTTGVNSTPNESALLSGAAYVFTRSGTTWTQQAYLKASNTGDGDNFGISVAVSGDTVLVGTHKEDSSTMGVNSSPDESYIDFGAAYVFTRSGTTWTQQAYLKASNSGANDAFGWSVAVSADTAVVGAFVEDSSTTGVNSTPNESASGSGAAYVFTRSGTTWTQQAYLKASTSNAGGAFGHSVAVSADTVAVGAPGERSSTTGVNSTPNNFAANSGAAYIFTGLGPPPAPIVTAIAPTSGSTAGGTSVTITGTGFTGATAVTLGGAAATGIIVVNATTISATTGAHAAGVVAVGVTTSFGATGTSTGLYTYANIAPVFTSAALAPTHTLGTAYSSTLTASGSPAPTFSIQSGSIPPGLALSSAGILNGSPTAVGAYSGVFAATNIQGTATQAFSFTVVAPPVFTSAALAPMLTLGTSYNTTLTASGYPVPTFGIQSGSIPPGLTLTAAGALSGTPTAPGSYSGVFRATNSQGTVTQPFAFTVNAPALNPNGDSQTGPISIGATVYYQVTLPAGNAGARFVLSTSGSGSADLYLQRTTLASASSYLKASTGQAIDTLFLTPEEATPATYSLAIVRPAGQTGTLTFTLTFENIYARNLAWDPGTSDIGTQMFTASSSSAGGAYLFKIITSSTAVGAWRTALRITSGTADVYLMQNSAPTIGSYSYKSDRPGTTGDGMVVPAGSFQENQTWYALVVASPGAEWSLVSGEAYVQNLGGLAWTDTNSNGAYDIGEPVLPRAVAASASSPKA